MDGVYAEQSMLLLRLISSSRTVDEGRLVGGDDALQNSALEWQASR